MKAKTGRSRTLKSYWRNVRRVSQRTNRSVSEIRSIYRGQSNRLPVVVKLHDVRSAVRRDASKSPIERAAKMYRVRREDVRAAYDVLVTYGKGMLERIVTRGERPADVPASVWNRMSYVPESGSARGRSVIYRHTLTGKYYGLKAMREWYHNANAIRSLAQMPEVIGKANKGFIETLPQELVDFIPKAARKRGYMTEREAVRWIKELRRQVYEKKDGLILEYLLDFWPELGDGWDERYTG